MEDILTCAMGLDVHRDVIVACLIKGELNKKPEVEIKSFSTLRPDMEKLKEWVLKQKCKNVAMESTGIYWQPVYEILEDCFDGEIELLVVNARHIKNVPGKKTDMRDSQWIATLLRAGLLRGSFIPGKTFRELRHLTRYRKSIIRDITSQKNRIDKLLQSSGFRLAAFVSDIFGATGKNIIRHLFTYGSITKDDLDKCVKAKSRNKIDQILIAVNGNLSQHQQDFLKLMFEHYEQLVLHKKMVEKSIEKEIMNHSEALYLLCSIPGIDVTAASSIIAEIGTNMSSFPTSQHICSWAGLSPGNNESAGKRKSCHIGKGNPYLKSMLCEVGWVIVGKRNTYLANWYWRIKSQKGAKRATVAVARKILVLIFTMLKSCVPYDEGNYEARKQQCEKRKANRFIQELTRMGYKVVAPN
jgi:transposase